MNTTKNTNDRDQTTKASGSAERAENAYRPDVASAVAKHPFFARMGPHELRLLTDCAMLEHFEPGELLLRESDPANRFYLIIKGKIVLQSFTGNEKGRVTIQTLTDGEVLGWSWLFPPYYWHFDARAVEPTDVIFLYATPLRAECEADHDFGYEMLTRISEVIVNRLQNTRQQLLKIF